jgi:hypothetical protein
MGGACSTDEAERDVYRFWWGNLKEINHWGDPGVDGNIIGVLRWIVRNGMWGQDGDRRQVVGICECGNELSGSVKCGKFLD